MIHLTLHIRWGPWKKALLLFAGLACALLSGVFVLNGEASQGSEALAPEFLPKGSGRHFYLTNFSVRGNQALTACAVGYHTASLWEIYDVSNLTYDSSHPNAYKKADSGQGPPSLWYGWVRTGYDSSTSNVPGTGNCANWTSITAAHSGTIIRLTNNWNVSPGGIGPWEPDPWTCAGTAPVWCVGSFYSAYLPVLNK